MGGGAHGVGVHYEEEVFEVGVEEPVSLAAFVHFY